MRQGIRKQCACLARQEEPRGQRLNFHRSIQYLTCCHDALRLTLSFREFRRYDPVNVDTLYHIAKRKLLHLFVDCLSIGCTVFAVMLILIKGNHVYVLPMDLNCVVITRLKRTLMPVKFLRVCTFQLHDRRLGIIQLLIRGQVGVCW